MLFITGSLIVENLCISLGSIVSVNSDYINCNTVALLQEILHRMVEGQLFLLQKEFTGRSVMARMIHVKRHDRYPYLCM